jgi:Rad3-related DNA helicase
MILENEKLLESNLKKINQIYKNKNKLKSLIKELEKKSSEPGSFWKKILENIDSEKKSENNLQMIYNVYLKTQNLEIDENEGQTKMTWQQKKKKFKTTYGQK